MTANPAAPERQHALDNLRALMMWLGIVLHVAANHLTGPMLLPWRDKDTSEFADVLVAVIHVFRMPVFLILAGYFVALLVDRRGAHQMLRHRMRRIALPFVLFWPVLFALTGVLAMLYAFRAERGYFGLSLEVVPTVPHAPLINTLHLWFLYQLAGLALLTFAALWLIPRLPKSLRHRITLAFRQLGERPWGSLVLALPLGLIGAQYSFGILTVTGSFVPPLEEWLHHGLFYAFGYFLYFHRKELLAQYTVRSHHFLWAGALLCFVSLGMLKEVQRNPEATGIAFRVLAAWAYNAATWLWSFGLIGLALRHLNRPSPAMQYMSDSSYWVYLVHMLGTIGFGALLYGADLPAEIKMLLNIAATTVMGLATYHFFVRNSVVGELLNGKRHPPAKVTQSVRSA
jgi:fucose 4-O-acetylase-like acetyltransferase